MRLQLEILTGRERKMALVVKYEVSTPQVIRNVPGDIVWTANTQLELLEKIQELVEAHFGGDGEEDIIDWEYGPDSVRADESNRCRHVHVEYDDSFQCVLVEGHPLPYDQGMLDDLNHPLYANDYPAWKEAYLKTLAQVPVS